MYSLYAHFSWEFLSWMNAEFIICFFYIWWGDHVVFIFSFVDVVYHIDWLCMLDHHCYGGMNPTWSSCISFSCVVAFCLLIFCWEFYIYIFQRYWPVIFFFGSVFVWFWYQGDSGFIKWLWECSLLLSLLEEFEKDLCKFFIGLLEFPYEAIYGPELLFAGSFFFFNYRFYFTSTGQSLQIMYFFFGGLLYF